MSVINSDIGREVLLPVVPSPAYVLKAGPYVELIPGGYRDVFLPGPICPPCGDGTPPSKTTGILFP